MFPILYEINTVYRSYLENEDVKCLLGKKKKKKTELSRNFQGDQSSGMGMSHL